MAELAVKFAPYVDEQFSTESKTSLLTNQDFNWTGAKTVKVYKIGIGTMNDYGRSGPNGGNWSRYGAVESLDATTEDFTLEKDRSFTFAIDTMDTDETVQQLEAASALARQQREVVIPEVDKYVYGKIAAGAGTKVEILSVDNSTIYKEILKGSKTLDNAQAPEEGRQLVVTPDTLLLMKQCKDIVMETDIGNDLRIRGVISNLDGMNVIKVPESRLPKDCVFMIVHPCATVAPTKLASYNTHMNPPGISGQLVEGRIVYDAFVLENKKMAIYYAKKKSE